MYRKHQPHQQRNQFELRRSLARKESEAGLGNTPSLEAYRSRIRTVLSSRLSSPSSSRYGRHYTPIFSSKRFSILSTPCSSSPSSSYPSKWVTKHGNTHILHNLCSNFNNRCFDTQFSSLCNNPLCPTAQLSRTHHLNL